MQIWLYLWQVNIIIVIHDRRQRADSRVVSIEQFDNVLHPTFRHVTDNKIVCILRLVMNYMNYITAPCIYVFLLESHLLVIHIHKKTSNILSKIKNKKSCCIFLCVTLMHSSIINGKNHLPVWKLAQKSGKENSLAPCRSVFGYL